MEISKYLKKPCLFYFYFLLLLCLMWTVPGEMYSMCTLRLQKMYVTGRIANWIYTTAFIRNFNSFISLMKVSNVLFHLHAVICQQLQLFVLKKCVALLSFYIYMKCCGIHSPASQFLSFEVNNTKKKKCYLKTATSSRSWRLSCQKTLRIDCCKALTMENPYKNAK